VTLEVIGGWGRVTGHTTPWARTFRIVATDTRARAGVGRILRREVSIITGCRCRRDPYPTHQALPLVVDFRDIDVVARTRLPRSLLVHLNRDARTGDGLILDVAGGTLGTWCFIPRDILPDCHVNVYSLGPSHRSPIRISRRRGEGRRIRPLHAHRK
jgi:hypothetical protein